MAAAANYFRELGWFGDYAFFVLSFFMLPALIALLVTMRSARTIDGRRAAERESSD
jgi:hypothetical protein